MYNIISPFPNTAIATSKCCSFLGEGVAAAASPDRPRGCAPCNCGLSKFVWPLLSASRMCLREGGVPLLSSHCAWSLTSPSIGVFIGNDCLCEMTAGGDDLATTVWVCETLGDERGLTRVRCEWCPGGGSSLPPLRTTMLLISSSAISTASWRSFSSVRSRFTSLVNTS